MSENRVSYTLDSTLETVNSAEEAASRMATDAGFGDEIFQHFQHSGARILPEIDDPAGQQQSPTGEIDQPGIGLPGIAVPRPALERVADEGVGGGDHVRAVGRHLRLYPFLRNLAGDQPVALQVSDLCRPA